MMLRATALGVNLHWDLLTVEELYVTFLTSPSYALVSRDCNEAAGKDWVCVSISLSHPAAHSGLTKATLFSCKKEVGSLALGCRPSPSPVLLTAGEDPWRPLWKHLTHAARTTCRPGSRCYRHAADEGGELGHDTLTPNEGPNEKVTPTFQLLPDGLA